MDHWHVPGNLFVMVVVMPGCPAQMKSHFFQLWPAEDELCSKQQPLFGFGVTSSSNAYGLPLINLETSAFYLHSPPTDIAKNGLVADASVHPRDASRIRCDPHNLVCNVMWWRRSGWNLLRTGFLAGLKQPLAWWCHLTSPARCSDCQASAPHPPHTDLF